MTQSHVQRVCKCGCGKLFPVPACRPGTHYSFGHKPKRAGGAAGAALESLGRSGKERRVLDYRIALQTARAELKTLAIEIDERDDLIATARENLRRLEAEKESATDRHLTVATSIDILEALIDGKSVRELAASEGNAA
jgi:hypothetical protein